MFAIFVSALGCAHRDPSAPAWKPRVIRPREAAEPSEKRAPAAPKVFSGPDAWWHRAIAEREARIEALRQQLERARGREDEQDEDVKGRLERELELEEESLHEFREASTKRYSPGMIGAGAALVVAGGAFLVAAGLVNLYGRLEYPEPKSSTISDEAANVATVVLLPHGVSCLAVGLPLLAVGNKKVPKSEPTARVWVGPGEVSVRGSF